MKNEQAKWTVFTKIEKYFSKESYSRDQVDEVLEVKGNLLLNDGIDVLWSLVCGSTGYDPFDNTNAHLGVGDSSVSADAVQEGLQATTNRAYRPMDIGYPVFGSNGKAIFKATFGDGFGEFDWNEWSIANGSDQATSVNLNRKVEAMGTKTTGSTWVITVELSLT